MRGIGGIGNNDLGEVQDIYNSNIITKVGVVDKATYSIPKEFVDKFDGHTLCLRITKEETDSRFQIKD